MEKNNSKRWQKDEKPYESIEDWCKEISYLKWPLIIFVIVVLILLVLFDLDVI